jgi:hypothetical protein
VITRNPYTSTQPFARLLYVFDKLLIDAWLQPGSSKRAEG